MKMAEIKVEQLAGKGIKAVVVDGGQQYSTFKTFAVAAGYPESANDYDKRENIAAKAGVLEGKVVNVLAKGKHPHGYVDIYVCQAKDGRQFLIGSRGIDLIVPEFPTIKSATLEELLEELRLRYRAAIEPGDKAFELTRKDIVNQAKADIEELKHFGDCYLLKRQAIYLNADFVINEEKRTVVALLRGLSSGEVYVKGIAKCDPADCFNEHIGKAIALRRALGLDVPAEYLNAPQPEGKQVGDIVDTEIGPLKLIANGEKIELGSTARVGSVYGTERRVINDTGRY